MRTFMVSASWLTMTGTSRPAARRLMTAGAQMFGDAVPAPATVPGAVDENDVSHGTRLRRSSGAHFGFRPYLRSSASNESPPCTGARAGL